MRWLELVRIGSIKRWILLKVLPNFVTLATRQLMEQVQTIQANFDFFFTNCIHTTDMYGRGSGRI